MTELRKPKEVDMIPDALRYVPQVKSDIIIGRREVSLAPVEGMNIYERDGTNTITFNVQGHKTMNQLMDTKSLYFTWQCKFKGGLPVEDVSNLVEEIIISSNGRVLERIRHKQYIDYYLKQYLMSRPAKARLGKREGYDRFEDNTIQLNKMSVPDSDHGFRNSPVFDDTANNTDNFSRMSDNLGYDYFQTNRDFQTGSKADGWPKWDAAGAAADGNKTDAFGWKQMKFRLKCSGLLSCDKMLPIGWMPMTVQLRLSDKMRATDKGDATFDYVIKKPRMHFSVCTCGQAYASAMQQRLRGPGITINAKLFDTFFQVINSDKQIVIPSNKQRLSKVYLMFHDEASVSDPQKNAFRSSVTGAYVDGEGLKSVGISTGDNCLQSYQFQVGVTVSEPVTLEDQSKGLDVYARNAQASGANPNTGMPYLEAYLKSIGAVNGHEQDVEYWGRKLEPLKCKSHEGGDLLQTFLSKYFVAVYDGEKFLGSAVESGEDTEAGRDIVCDVRWRGGAPYNQTRVMALICYHCQFTIKESSVEISY